MTAHRSLRSLLLSELLNGPGTCTDLAERLRSRGHHVYDTSVQRTLRALAEEDAILELVAEAEIGLTRRESLEGGTAVYELATPESEVA